MGGGKGGAPNAPNPKKVAKAQGEENRKTALTTAMLGNPNVTNSYGSQSVSYTLDPTTGNYVPNLSQTLNPVQQGLLDKSNAIQGQMGDIGMNVAQNAQGTYGQPLSFDGAPAMPGDAQATRDKVMAAMMGRVDDDTAKSRDQVQSELTAAGIPAGSKAYADRMALVDRGYNDARSQAMLASGQEATRDFGMDMQGRQQGISEILAQRNQPLNELNAISSGTQVAQPQFGDTKGANVAPVDIAGLSGQQYAGEMNAYNAQVGQQNSILSGGATVAAAYFM